MAALAAGEKTVAVGRDGRLSGPSLSGALMQGLTDVGVNVIDIGMATTPMLYFAAATVVTTISFAVGGLFVRELLFYALLTGPLYGVGLFLGSRLFGLASERSFRRACYALIVAAAVLGLPVLDGVLR